MKSVITKAIGFFPNKQQFLILFAMFCIMASAFLAGLTWFVTTVKIPVLEDTIFNRYHGHSTRYVNFNHETNLAQNKAIELSDNIDNLRLKYYSLRQEMREHNKALYDIIDNETGDFVSPIKEKIWNNTQQELKEDMREVEQELRVYKTSRSKQMLIAKRSR